jgi:hypothetical protein
MKRRRDFVVDRAVRAYLVLVSMPSLAFFARLAEGHEAAGVEALGAELAVQAFDESVICRLAPAD